MADMNSEALADQGRAWARALSDVDEIFLADDAETEWLGSIVAIAAEASVALREWIDVRNASVPALAARADLVPLKRWEVEEPLLRFVSLDTPGESWWTILDSFDSLIKARQLRLPALAAPSEATDPLLQCEQALRNVVSASAGSVDALRAYDALWHAYTSTLKAILTLEEQWRVARRVPEKS